MDVKSLEFEKVAPIIISIISTVYAIGVSLYINYRNRKKDKVLTTDEINFVLSRAGQNDPLNTQLPIHEESKLIEKSYGFYATREQFNNLYVKLDESYDIKKIKHIKKFLEFDNNTPYIKFESADKLIVRASTVFLFIIAAITVWKSVTYRESDWFTAIMLVGAITVLSIMHLFIEPYRQAKKVKGILEKEN